jgi:cob(I)alamin adenosyltransferase
VLNIEEWIDSFDNCLQPLTTFIIQDGKNAVEVQAHICRTVTRRVERELNKYGNIDETILKFINRLSDYFFTLARFVSEKLISIKASVDHI